MRVLDCFDPQVHGDQKPAYLNAKAMYIDGNICDPGVVKEALQDIDTIVHCAALTSTRLSEAQEKQFYDANVRGTEILLDEMATSATAKRFILTSSVMVYGQALRIPISENEPKYPISPYGASKSMQEELVMAAAERGICTAMILRLFNVYGPRQSLRNPYVGVASIFLSRLRQNLPPLLHGDGRQSRDFIFIDDVVDAIIAAIDHKQNKPSDVLNIGTGQSTSVEYLAEVLVKMSGKKLQPQHIDHPMNNDIRSSCADIRQAQKVLGWQPQIALEGGLRKLYTWGEWEPLSEILVTATHSHVR